MVGSKLSRFINIRLNWFIRHTIFIESEATEKTDHLVLDMSGRIRKAWKMHCGFSVGGEPKWMNCVWSNFWNGGRQVYLLCFFPSILKQCRMAETRPNGDMKSQWRSDVEGMGMTTIEWTEYQYFRSVHASTFSTKYELKSRSKPFSLSY